MDKRLPTRLINTERVAEGSAGQGTGWLESLRRGYTDLKAQLSGIHSRIVSPFKHGFPSCIDGELEFKADLNTTITIANFPSDPEQGTFISPLLCNPIVRAGQTYRVPIINSPPGVLMARNLRVQVLAGFTTFNNTQRMGIYPLPDYRQRADQEGAFISRPTTGTLRYTWQQQVLGTFADVMPFLPYFWNLIDEKSGRQYAQDWIPSGLLLNGRMPAQVQNYLPDGELFELDYPWLMERDAQLAFHFRPIMDLYQIAAADATLPWGTNDLSGGRRVQQATVRVEIHGTRYYDNRDIRKDGAVL